MGFVWGTLNCRTREQDGAGQPNSLNSGWRGGAAELVVPAVGKALWDLLASWVGSSHRCLGVR